jgi:hypothetical protein
MDHEPNRAALPVFQLAIREGKLQFRMTQIKEDGSRGWMKYGDIGVMQFKESYHVDLEGLLSNDIDLGYLVLTVNGVTMSIPIPTVTASPTDEGVQVQYGVYGHEDYHMRLIVEKLAYSYTLIDESDSSSSGEQDDVVISGAIRLKKVGHGRYIFMGFGE